MHALERRHRTAPNSTLGDPLSIVPRFRHRHVLHRATAIAIFVVVILAGVGLLAWSAGLDRGYASVSPVRSNPASAYPNPVSAAGAPSGFGLTSPSALQARAPIHIDGNNSFTAANGVRSGSGIQADPYVISNWLIDMTNFPNTTAGLWIQHSTRYVTVSNVEIMNLKGPGNFFGILLGTNVYPPVTTDWAENITVTHVLLKAVDHGYGIESSYYTRNNNISLSAIYMNATQMDWVYGITAQGGSQNIVIWGNYVDARNAQTGPPYTIRTVGIQSGDGCIVYLNASNPYPCATVTVAYNTVTNATAEAFVSDGTTHASFFNNLGYQNYPGRRVLSTSPSRGILVESRSNYTKVHDNVFYQYDNAIEVGAWGGWYWNNTVHDSGWGVIVDSNGSFGNVAFTDFNVIWNTASYNNANGNFKIPSNQYTVLLNLGAGVTPTTFPLQYINQGGQTIDEIRYVWNGADFSLSYSLAAWGYMDAVTVFDYQTSTFSQSLQASWTGSNLALSVSRFSPNDVAYNLSSSTTATFSGSQFTPASDYQIYQAGTVLSTQTSNVAGDLSFAMPTPVSSAYEIRYGNSLPAPSVSISLPTNGTWVTTASLQVRWSVNDSAAGVKSVTLAVDGGTPTDVTSLASYTLANLADGQHVVTVTATDDLGLSATASGGFSVDTHPPQISIEGPTDNATVNTANLLVSWNVTDAISGVSQVMFQLDGGPSIHVQGDNYLVGGLANGSHTVIVSAVDNAGLSDTNVVHFSVEATNPANGAGEASPPGVATIAYMPEQSSVDITFTQPMNHTSVEGALVVYPDVTYRVEWVSDTQVRLLLNGTLADGEVYQVTLTPAATTATGRTFQYPFLFQFVVGSASGVAGAAAANWIPIALIVAAVLIVNWATAGLLVAHYRKSANQVRSALQRVTKRYRGSLVIVYKRLARTPSTRGASGSRAPSKARVKNLAAGSTRPELKSVKAPFSFNRK